MKLLCAKEDIVIVEKDEELDIIYSPYSNKVLAMSKAGTKWVQLFERVSKKNNGDIRELFDNHIDSDVQNLIDVLVANKIFFRCEEDFKAADYSLSYKEKEIFSLHKAYLHLTQRCNLKCKYCYNANNIGKTKDMSTQQWKDIISKLKAEGFDYIVFTGGEVFLREDLKELTDYVKNLEMKLHILTNGTLEISKEIIEAADVVEVSLDAINEDTNETNRVNSKKYGVYDNLLQIPKELRNKIAIKTVLSKTNFDSILEMREILKKDGFLHNEIILQQPNNPDDVDIYPNKILPREKHKFDAKMISKCNGCYEIIAINADGNIFPCQALIKDELLLANIFETDWKEKIKKNRITDIFVNDDVTTSECRNCAFRYICGGPCKAVSYNLTSDFYNGRGEYCERAKKESIEYLRSIDFGI